MEYHQITLDEYLMAKENIKKGLNQAMGNFVYIGYWLKKVRDSQSYRQDGYASIVEFGKGEYNLTDSAISRFMKINDEFSVGGYGMELDEKYKDYGSSKLSEMLTLPALDRELIRPDTNRDDIRELKKLNREKPTENDSDLTVDMLQTLRDVFENDEAGFNLICRGCSDEEFSELINPGGNMVKRRGLSMIFFYPYQEGLKYKKYGADPQTLDYRWLHQFFMDCFEESLQAYNPWKDAYGIEENEPALMDIKEEAVSEEKKEDLTPEEEAKEPEKPESIKEEQIPGQDNIMNHPEYLPKEKSPETLSAGSFSEKEPPEVKAEAPKMQQEEPQEAERPQRAEYSQEAERQQEPVETQPEARVEAAHPCEETTVDEEPEIVEKPVEHTEAVEEKRQQVYVQISRIRNFLDTGEYEALLVSCRMLMDQVRELMSDV